jgi:hypothetical protein
MHGPICKVRLHIESRRFDKPVPRHDENFDPVAMATQYTAAIATVSPKRSNEIKLYPPRVGFLNLSPGRLPLPPGSLHGRCPTAARRQDPRRFTRGHPLILTGTVVARKALRHEAHRSAASGLDPRRHPGALAGMSSTPLLPFPRTRSRTVSDVENDHLVAHDFIHDQIFADRKAQEAGLACRASNVWRSGNPRRHSFNTSDKAPRGFPTVRSYVCKNLIEIGKCAAFISELHAPR